MTLILENLGKLFESRYKNKTISLNSDGKITGSHGYMSSGVYEITIRVTIGNITKQIQFNAIVN